ncbi:MAG: tripartite tricarboxylate transporter substrate binding protein [Betaproteobacteria bacterium]
MFEGLRRGLAALLAATPLLVAAQPYPAKPVTIVSPYSAGGNADLAARSIAVTAAKSLGQPVVVVNRTGAGGIVGSQFVADAAPDGYTLLLARVGSQAVAPALDPATTYKWDSFTFLGVLESDPYVCVVLGKSPLRTFQDLVAAVRAKPGKLSYASTGNADASVVFPVKMFLNSGLKYDAAVKVPYKGAGDTVAAVLGGHVDFACNGISPYTAAMRSGDLRGLVVSTKARVAEAPDVPTASEVGMPDLETVSGWSALYGPPGLPREVVERWAGVLAAARDDAEWNQQVRRRGSIPSIMPPDETRRFVEAQYKAYRSLSSQLGVK